MMRNVDQQILLLEGLNDKARLIQHCGDNLERGGRDGGLGDEDAGVKIVLTAVVGEVAHLLYADGLISGEFDPDGADDGNRVGVCFCFEWGIFLHHGGCGFEGCCHFLAAVEGVSYVLGWGGGKLGGRLWCTAGI